MRSYESILAYASMPTTVVVLDFECYFDQGYSMGRSAQALSTVEYIMSPKFECLGLGSLARFADPAHSPARASFCHDAASEITRLQGLYGPRLQGCTVVCHNAAFDAMILAKRFGVVPTHIVDTLGLARHVDPSRSNSLASLCKQYGLTEKGETMQFQGYGWTERLGPPTIARQVFAKRKKQPERRVIGPNLYQEVLRQGMDPGMKRALAAYCCNDVEREMDLFEILLPMLTNPTVELKLMRHTLGLFLEPLIGVDLVEGDRLVVAMELKTQEAAASVGHTPEELRKDTFIGLLVAEGAKVPMKHGKNGLIPALAKNDEGLNTLCESGNPRVTALVKARAAVKSWPLHAARVRRILAQARANGGLLPVPLKYCGAHTGRWSGGERINLQNLGARGSEDLVNAVRTLLIAPAGKVFAIADAAQIEARVLAYLAGQENLVRAFANNEPIYENFASELLGIPVTKEMKERALGKVGVLGCGYGMGADRCENYARNAYGIATITWELAKQLVDFYRASNPQICRYWSQVEGAFKYVTKYPHEVRKLDRGVWLYNENDTTCIALPNGRVLRYAGARVRGRGRDEQVAYPDTQRPGTWTETWGGGLVENIVQATSRDLLGHALLLSETLGESIGLKIGLHVHDELIAVVDEEHGGRALEILIESLSTRPVWLPGCPLAAEGWQAWRYQK